MPAMIEMAVVSVPVGRVDHGEHLAHLLDEVLHHGAVPFPVVFVQHGHDLLLRLVDAVFGHRLPGSKYTWYPIGDIFVYPNPFIRKKQLKAR